MEDTLTSAVQLRDGSQVSLEVAEDGLMLVIRVRDDAGDGLGIATCDLTPSTHPRSISVEVAASARRRGVGTALFKCLIEEAEDRGIAWLTYTGPADDALLRMAATSGSICARRVNGDLAKSVILVPEHRAA